MNYNFEQKNHWRNTIWNRIAERIKCRPENAIVLYLAAEQDLDRDAALKRGFVNNNLIAVDRDGAAVDAIRSAGNLCIHGDVIDVMRTWPEHTPVSAVIADFMCGLEESLMERFMVGSMAPGVRDCVFLCNLLRGRDASSNDLRGEWLSRGIKNRSEIMAYEQIGLSDTACGDSLTWLFMVPKFAKVVKNLTPARINGGGLKARNISLISGCYKSGYQRFDWALWNNRRNWSKIELGFNFGNLTTEQASTKLRIAATLAHRTRRIANAA